MPAKTATPTLPLLLLLLNILLPQTSCQPSPQFSWSSIQGSSYIIAQVYSQNFPYPCNAGWAFSAIDVFNSRMKIRRNASSPDFQISGEPVSAFKWIKKNWVTDSSCQGYRAQGYTNGLGCSSELKCQTCQTPTCKPTPNSKLYTVHDYGLISGQTNIMQQIQKYGPVACGINSTGLINYTSGIIKNNGLITNRHDHFVFVYGWGVENGVKFWRCKNSWGTAWGESGYFRVEKGSNVLGIQGSCAWAGPQDTWTDDIRNKTIPNSLPPQPLTYQIPPHLTPIKSSLTPHQCTSAWAFSVTQMIADRQSHRTNGQNLIRLSVQGLINCGVGKCSKGGSPIDALIFIQKYGLAQENCQNYLGVDPDKESCSGVSNCAVCQGSVFQYRCSQPKNYKRWRILEHGFFTGADNMKNYLYDGPIVCGIFASEEFKKYQGGIFSEISVSPKIDHYVQIVGYGSEEGKNYWLGRNFWGTAWGESSMFRIQMGGNNLGIESKCYYSKGLI